MQMRAAGIRAASVADLGMGAGVATNSNSHPESTREPGVRLRDVPLPVAAVLITMLVPRELEFQVGVTLTAQRIVLLILLPLALMRLVTSRTVTFRAFDFLLVGTFVYFWLALFPKETLDTAIKAGSGPFLEAVGGYTIARVYVRSDAQFRATASLLFTLVLITGAAAAIELVFHVHWLKNIARAISGAAPTWTTELRLGLMRASANFDHPIHYGAFCASMFGLVWFLERNAVRRLVRATLVGLAAFFSLSSAAFLGVGLVLVGSVWERVTRGIAHRVWLSIGTATLLYLLASLLTTRSPTEILSTTFVLDPQSAYYRLQIWEYGIENVINHPLIGVPIGTWVRPKWMFSDSVDNYWLSTALFGGIPAVILYLLAIATLMIAVHKEVSTGNSTEQRACRHAWTTLVLVMIMIGTTVHIWRELEVYFTFCLGLGGSLMDHPRGIPTEPKNDGFCPVPIGERDITAYVEVQPPQASATGLEANFKKGTV